MHEIRRFQTPPGMPTREPNRPKPSERPEPQPTETYQGSDNGSPWTRIGLGAALAVVSVAALTGCTQESPPAPDTVQTQPENPQTNAQLLTDPQAEVLPPGTARVDLVRQTTKDSDGDEHDVDYSPIGIHLGGGVFQDTNGNLSLVPELAFGEEVGLGRNSRVDIDGPGWNNIDVRRSGSELRTDGPGWEDYTLRDGGSHGELRGPTFNSYDFDRRGNTTRVDGPGWNDYEVTRHGNTISVDLPGWNDFTIKYNGDTINIDGPGWNDYTLTRSGSTIRVDGPGWGDTTITRNDDYTTRVDGPGWSDYTITRSDGKVTIDGPGWDDYTLTVRP